MSDYPKNFEETGSKALSQILDTMGNPAMHIFLRLIPEQFRKKYLIGKIQNESVKHNKDFFDSYIESISNKKIELLNSNPSSDINIFDNQRTIDDLKKHYNLIITLRDTYIGLINQYNDKKYIENHSKEEQPSFNEKTSISWFDLFKEIAERDCESWRRALIVQAAIHESLQPGSISLKVLWNIAMLEESTFLLFQVYLETSVLLDDYPVILFNDENSNEPTYLSMPDEKEVYTTLSLMTASLLEHGLISIGDFQLSTIDDIFGITKNHFFKLKCKAENISFPGTHCTDLGLALFQLYPKIQFNEYSDKNFVELMEMLHNDKHCQIIEQEQQE